MKNAPHGTMTVGDLRKLLAGLDDSIPVLVRWNDDTCCHVAGALPATVESGCAERPALMIDADVAEIPEDSDAAETCPDCEDGLQEAGTCGHCDGPKYHTCDTCKGTGKPTPTGSAS